MKEVVKDIAKNAAGIALGVLLAHAIGSLLTRKKTAAPATPAAA